MQNVPLGSYLLYGRPGYWLIDDDFREQSRSALLVPRYKADLYIEVHPKYRLGQGILLHNGRVLKISGMWLDASRRIRYIYDELNPGLTELQILCVFCGDI